MSYSSEKFSFEEDAARPRSSKRVKRILFLQALIFTPLAFVMAAGVIYASLKVASGETGYIVMLTITGILFLVFTYQSLHYLRDMRTEPIVSEGEVSKKWSKGNLFFFFMPGYYIAVKGQIYTITRDQYRGLLEDDLVRISHYPHSLTVERVERYDEAKKEYVPAEPDGLGY
ncbi:MAG TPA: hypothetical protein VNN10_00880 [Dehalococcoidia bacterium]|nr:hypothetical protein [Dehalococcoidia bacterium]